MRRRAQGSSLPDNARQGEIQAVTGETRHAAVELLVRFFREEGFATPSSRASGITRG
jgi:hypothetical protein